MIFDGELGPLWPDAEAAAAAATDTAAAAADTARANADNTPSTATTTAIAPPTTTVTARKTSATTTLSTAAVSPAALTARAHPPRRSRLVLIGMDLDVTKLHRGFLACEYVSEEEQKTI